MLGKIAILMAESYQIPELNLDHFQQQQQQQQQQKQIKLFHSKVYFDEFSWWVSRCLKPYFLGLLLAIYPQNLDKDYQRGQSMTDFKAQVMTAVICPEFKISGLKVLYTE